jgi:hypothetical protein
MVTGVGLIVQLLPLLGAPAPAPVDPYVGRGAVEWAPLGARVAVPVDTPVTRTRRPAIEYGSGYNKRLKLHRILSFAMVPLFVGSFVTGDELMKGKDQAPGWARSLHTPFALGTAAVFTANTITGVWNLWESRKDPTGRTKRLVHSAMFIAAGAGFTMAGLNAPDDDDEAGNGDDRRNHRNLALASMGVSVASWGLMLFF